EASGQLGYSETSSMTSFNDRQSTARDVITTQTTYGDAAYLLTPSWRLQFKASDMKQTNSDTASQVNDVTVQAVDARVSYVSRAANQIGVSLRQEDGRYPNPQTIGLAAVDNDYKQHSVGLAADWAITAITHLKARIDRLRRNFDSVPQRNYEGTTARAE